MKTNMNKFTVNIKALILIVAVLGAWLTLSPMLLSQDKDQGGDQNSFQMSKAWNKLDPSLQAAWLDATKAGDMSRRLDCFVRVRAPADTGDEAFLFSHGFNVRAFSGNIATGHVAAQDLQRVAELSFVDSIRSSKK